MRSGFLRFVAGCSTLVTAAACTTGDTLPSQDLVLAPGTGPRIVWNVGAQPLPDIPIPNDLATTPDPTSPTGVRLNASLLAPTLFERTLRADIDELDGWGTFMPISVAFDPAAPDLDLANLARRHHGDGYDMTDDAVYLVDLTTGVPVPLDIGNGNFPATSTLPMTLLPNDPRGDGRNLLFATVDEDTNHDGVLQADEDTNFDGVLQRAAVFPSGASPVDALTEYYEPESHTLIVRPAVALAERHRYAVVLTDRLTAPDGSVVRSPFDTLAHPTQLAYLAPLERYLADPALSSRFYGGLQWNPTGSAPHGRVVFAWTFQTETTASDLFELRDGLHGTGRFAALARTAPGFQVWPAHTGAGCVASDHVHPDIVSAAELQAVIGDFIAMIGFDPNVAAALVRSYDWLDYVAIAHYTTPYLFGDPQSADPDAHWHLDALAHNPSLAGTQDVDVWIWVPKATATAHAPFPVAFNAHGYGTGAFQSIAFAGYLARFGIATMAIDAPTHGFFLGSAVESGITTILRGQCLQGFGQAVIRGRARDLNGDGTVDSGADFLTAHIARTRDMVRQTAVDYMQLIRAMTDPSWSAPGTQDYDGDGHNDIVGDLNSDGVVDVGGAGQPFFMWGESLGGITSMVLGGLEPELAAVAPVSGGAGLTDVSVRSDIPEVQAAVLLPVLGPALITVPAAARAPDASHHTQTSCTGSQFSLRVVGQDANNAGELEIACQNVGADSSDMAPGDDVMVFNQTTNAVRCARVDRTGRLFLPYAADQGDELRIIVFDGHVVTDYATCATPSNIVMRSEITQYFVGEGGCDIGCGHVPLAAPNSVAQMNGVHMGDALTSRFTGLGLRRQTSALRRFIQLSQAGIDPGDPVNYARLFFLEPRTPTAHPILTMTTAGDPDVPVATGMTFARSAGLIPFIHTATGSALDDYVAPDALYAQNSATPDDVLISHHVVEGIAGLDRYPIAGGPMNYLFDAFDLDQGRSGFHEATLPTPLVLARAPAAVHAPGAPLADPSAAMGAIDAAWAPAAGQPVASYANAYVVPTGVHTFLPSNPSLPWDAGLYLTNLIARYFQTRGTDVEYYSDPSGHECLADSSCVFIPTTP